MSTDPKQEKYNRYMNDLFALMKSAEFSKTYPNAWDIMIEDESFRNLGIELMDLLCKEDIPIKAAISIYASFLDGLERDPVRAKSSFSTFKKGIIQKYVMTPRR